MRKVDRVALIAVLLLWGCPAQAGPVIPFVSAVVSAFGAGGFLASGTILGFAARTVLSIGLSALARRLQQRKAARGAETGRDLLANYAQPVTPMERAYGLVRKGGPLGFSAFRNGARHYTVLIAAHRTKGPVAHWLDRTAVALDGAGAVVTAPYAGFGNVRTYRGAAGQAVDATLDAEFAEITTAHDYAGLSYVAITAARPPQDQQATVYPAGREWIYTGLWEMNDTIYDPRSGATGFSRNAALVIAHELLHWGKRVDWAEVAAQADICDQVVATRSDGLRLRWLIDGVFPDDQEWESVQEQLSLACDAWFYERADGASGFKVGAWQEPGVTLTDRDFLSVTVSEGAHGPDVPKAFSVRYIEPLNDYVEAASAPYVIGPGPREEVESPLISHHNQAVRVAKRIGRSRLAQYSLAGTVKLIGYELIGQRFVRVSLASVGLDIVVEVDRLTRNADGLSFSLEAISAEEQDFAFDAATEEPPRIAVAQVASGDSFAEIDLAVDIVLVDSLGSVPVAKIDWSWPAQPAGLRQELWLQFSDDVTGAGATDFEIFTPPEGLTRISMTQALTGRFFIGRVRNVSSSGRVSDWYPTAGITVQVAGSGALPPALTSFAATVVGADVRIDYQGANSPLHVGVNIYRAAASTDFADAVLVRTNYSFASSVAQWLDLAPGTGSISYWGLPINSFGDEGPAFGPVTISI